MSNKLILVSGDKGGCGKSFVAGALSEMRIMNEDNNVVLIDGDPTNPDLARRYGENVKVEIMDLRDGDGWLDLMDTLEENSDMDIIVSAPAGAGETLKSKVETLREALPQLDRELVLVWPINRTYDSLHLLKANLEFLGEMPVKIVVVVNGFFGDIGKFRRWQESKLRAELHKRENFDEHFLVDLHERVVDATPGPYVLADGLKISAKAERDRWVKNVHELSGKVA